MQEKPGCSKMPPIIAVLASWLSVFRQFLRDATRFSWRLLTNRVGLSRWLWLAILVGIVVSVSVYVLTGK